MKIGKLGTRVKIKATGQTEKCHLLEVDELGNIIIQHNDTRRRIIQYHPDEVVVTHTFRTKVERFDMNGDVTLARTTRTATLRPSHEFGKMHYEWRENYMPRKLYPNADGDYVFHENNFVI